MVPTARRICHLHYECVLLSIAHRDLQPANVTEAGTRQGARLPLSQGGGVVRQRDFQRGRFEAISRTRRLIDLETHRAVFTWILQVPATADLVKGKTIGIDATTLEANAALRSIVRRDSGEPIRSF